MAAAAAAANHSHRAGKLKQQNKKNKRSNASKRSVSRRQGGKIQGGGIPSLNGGSGGRKGLKSNNEHTNRAKANRLNAAKQRRDASRKNVWNARRSSGGVVGVAGETTTGGGNTTSSMTAKLSRALSNAPPRIVGIISLSELEGPLEERVRRALTTTAVGCGVNNNAADKVLLSSSSVTASYMMHAKGGQPYITYLTNTSAFRSQYTYKQYGEEDASVQSALDLCRVCDLVLFLIDGSTAVDSSSGGGIVAPSAAAGDGHYSIAATSIKTSNTTAHLDHLVSERGDRILSAIKAQGLPTPVTVIVHKESVNNNGTNVVSGSGTGILDMNAMMDDDNNNDENDDDEDDGMEDDTFTSLNQHTATTSRSLKSIRRTQLRQRSELKRYISRFAITEFGVDAGGKVVELDIPSNLVDSNDGEIVKMDDIESTTAASRTTTLTSKATATTTTKSTSQTSIAALIRMICTMSASGPNWVADAMRPYLITDGTTSSTTGNANNTPAAAAAVQYDETNNELSLTGYIRGNTPWNCNQLVHVPHCGTFAIKEIKLSGVNTANNNDGEEVMLLLPPIIAAGRKVRKNKKSTTAASSSGDDNMEDASFNNKVSSEGDLVLARPDPEERESLDMFASPDALEGEQNLIGFDDDDHFDADDDDDNEGGKADGAVANNNKFQPGTSRPAGWSDYQSAWLDALDPNNEEDDEADDDRGELAFALNKKSKKPDGDDKDELMDDDDDEVNAEEKRALLAARKKSRDDNRQFPDEVDYEEETSARDRYARYRALKSFRKSYWDPKENLPDSYGAVYHFSSFKATQRDVLEDVRELDEIVKRRGWGSVVVDEVKKQQSGGDVQMNDIDEDSEDEEEEAMARASVPPGAYVTLTLEGVPPAAYANLSPTSIVSAVSLLPHENKVSVLHMGLSTSTKSEHDEEVPIKSKDVLTFRCGWRTWQSRPIFSQHNLNSDKHKFERYMPSNGGGGGGGVFFAASVFGPVTYAPCPVLMFREASDGSSDGGGSLVGGDNNDMKREFLAHGSMLGADADRIVLKRIILTGYPTRVHKRHATVKYMFYNPDDVKWFMPAGITTKHGLQGNIIQSVGDHGVMKCLFNAPIKQHDTVCLPLYKRVFPKFAPVVADNAGEEDGAGGSMSKHFRVL